MINKINLDGIEYDIGGSEAKFIGKIYISEEFSESQLNSIRFYLQNSLSECLKENTKYLVLYYNDDFGNMFEFSFIVDKHTVFDDGTKKAMNKCISIFFMVDENYDYKKAFVDYIYADEGSTFIHYIDINLENDGLIYNTANDYIEIYELPFTLGSDE